MSTTVEEVLATQGLRTSKPYGVTVIICDHSNGVVDGIIPITEYSNSAPENVHKYQIIADAVIEALNGGNEEGSGGVIREMGEEFQAAVDEMVANGDMEIDPAGQMMRRYLKENNRGQGKKKK